MDPGNRARTAVGMPSDAITPDSLATVRSVAVEAGVSPTTVSRVLRSNPNVRENVRRRVLEAARRQAYRPDPQLQKLMVSLRKRRIRRLQGSICTLSSTDWTFLANSYHQRVIDGARACANALGYAWETVQVSTLLQRPDHTVRMLQARGVEGILIPPVPQTVLLSPCGIWESFSVIAATYSVENPGFHRVVPDHFHNMQLLCRTLVERGCSRIGFAISTHLDRRVKFHFSGAYAAVHYESGMEPLPLFRGFGSDCRLRLREWFSQGRPDTIVAGSSWDADWIARYLELPVPGPVMFATVGALDFSESSASGIDELPEEVGAKAVERLSRKIVHQERGIPERPIVTMIEGVWHDAPA